MPSDFWLKGLLRQSLRSSLALLVAPQWCAIPRDRHYGGASYQKATGFRAVSTANTLTAPLAPGMRRNRHVGTDLRDSRDGPGARPGEGHDLRGRAAAPGSLYAVAAGTRRALDRRSHPRQVPLCR